MSITSVRPVNERIAQVLFDRLHLLVTGIKPATPIREVIRPKRLNDFTPQHLQIVMTTDEVTANDDLSHAGNPPAIAYDMTVNVHCHLLPSELDVTPIDEYINTAAADVAESITDAGIDWFNFGGLAIDAQIDPYERIDAGGGIDGFTLPVQVTYRVSENSHYEVRA